MMDFIPVSGAQLNIPAFLTKPGGMSERILHFNWSATSLGRVESWKQSLRSALSICLNSNFPIALYWGPDLNLIYNDAWSPIPGNKHPWALGRPAREVWPEIWTDIGPQFAKAFSGEPGGSKDAMLPMQRHGYTEECYFDFTFTPVYGEDGQIDGIFNAVIETTFQLIHERRASFLHNLSGKLLSASSSEDIFKKLILFLKSNPADIPFCFIYTLSTEGSAVPAGSTAPGTEVKDLPYAEILKTGDSKYIGEPGAFIKEIPTNRWPEKPTEGMLVPLKMNNGRITGFLFAGLSARRKYDQEYRIFIEGMAAIVSSSLNSIQSLEEERKRAELLNSARKKLEDSELALRIANDQLELSFQNVPAAIYLFDKTGKILFLNNQAAKLHGWESADEGMQKFKLNEFHDRSRELFDILDEEGNPFSMENAPTTFTMNTGQATEKIIHMIRKSDGNHQWILTKTSPLTDDEGELMMVLNCTTDITLQKQAEKKIRESEEHFRNLTQALPQLVWVTDANGKQEFVTERWKEYTGLDPRDEATWAQMIHPEDVQVLARAWNQSIQNGMTYKAEARLKGRDGNYRWFYVHGEPILADNKKITKWVGAFTDIQDQKSAQDLLRQSEEKLEFLVKKRTEELERSNEDLQQFAHVASHDLKEPIRKIKVFSGLLQEELSLLSNDKADHYLSKVQSASDRMLLMMEGVLRYAGLDGYQQGIEEIDLNKILQSVETDLELVIQKRIARIQRDELPVIRGFSILIYQLFYNLISNALKFSRSDRPLQIQILYSKVTIAGKDFDQFIVKDNGIGFDQGNAERIFYTFARLNSKEDYEGTGLGLSLCKKIVGRHHGFLTATGVPDIGAEFTIQLPT